MVSPPTVREMRDGLRRATLIVWIARCFSASGDSVTLARSVSGFGLSTFAVGADLAGAAGSGRRRVRIRRQKSEDEARRRRGDRTGTLLHRSHLAPQVRPTACSSRTIARLTPNDRVDARGFEVDQALPRFEQRQQRDFAGGIQAVGLCAGGGERRGDVSRQASCAVSRASVESDERGGDLGRDGGCGRRHSAGSPARARRPRARAGPDSARAAAARCRCRVPSRSPAVPLRVGVERRGQRDDPRFLQPGPRARGFDLQLGGAHLRPGRERRSQELGAGRTAVGHWRRRLDSGEARPSAGRARAASAAAPRARSRAVTRVRRAASRRSASVRASRASNSLMSPTRNWPSASFAACAATSACSAASVSRRSADEHFEERQPHVGDESQAAGDELLGSRFGVQPRVLDALGPLPELIDRERRRELELFRSPREEQREDRVPEQARFDRDRRARGRATKARPESRRCSRARWRPLRRRSRPSSRVVPGGAVHSRPGGGRPRASTPARSVMPMATRDRSGAMGRAQAAPSRPSTNTTLVRRHTVESG